MKKISEHISIDPNIRFGKPCIKGTRIAVLDILQWLSSGMNENEILEDYPILKAELPNLIITPHTAWVSLESRQRLVDEIALNIEAFKAGKTRNAV